MCMKFGGSLHVQLLLRYVKHTNTNDSANYCTDSVVGNTASIPNALTKTWFDGMQNDSSGLIQNYTQMGRGQS